MATHINSMEAFMIETLLAKGISKSDLIHSIKMQDQTTLRKYDQTFDYDELWKGNTTNLIKAIEAGYTVKFLTRNGIIGLLELKFGQKKDRDYQFQENKLIGVELTKDQLRSIEMLLSPNWKIVHKEELDLNRVVIEVWNSIELEK